MKFKYLLSVAICSISLLVACSNETSIDDGTNNPSLPEGRAIVKFSFNGIGSAARSYADIAPDDALQECRIDSVMVYVFNNEAATTTEPDANAILEDIAKIEVTALNAEKDEYSAQATFINKGPKWIVVVANFKDTASISEGMVYSQFIEQCTPGANSLPTTPFIMSGMNYGTLNSNTPLVTTIELTRAVTRIDITIRNSETVNGTTPFKLKQVRLTNVNKKGFLMWNSDGAGAFNEPADQRFSTEWIDVESDVLTSNVADSLWHYLYTYETLASTNNQVVLEIKGNYKGQPSEYKIPLTRDADTNITPNVPLRNLVRNHRYLVYIDSVTYIDVEGEVIVSDWDFTERDTIPYEPGVSFGAPVATIQNAGNYTVLPGQLIGRLQVDTIVVPGDGYTADDVIIFDVTSYNIRSEFSSSVGWITATEVSSYALNSDTVAIAQRFEITVADSNEGNLREGYFEFRNPIMKHNKVGFCIKQEAGTIPLMVVTPSVGSDVTINDTNVTALWTGGVVNFLVANYKPGYLSTITIPTDAQAWVSSNTPTVTDNTTDGTKDQAYVVTVAANNTSYASRNTTISFQNGVLASKRDYTITQNGVPEAISGISISGGSKVEGKDSVYVVVGGGELTITLTDVIAGYSVSTTGGALSGATKGTPVAGTGNYSTPYTFTVAEGTEWASAGTIVFSNTAQGGSTTYTLHLAYAPVVFAGTPLVKWAKGNLTAVNSSAWTELTPATAGTATEAIFGKIFQWGRNYAFNSTLGTPPATSTSIISATDVTTTTWVTANPWHGMDGLATDTWTVINGATKSTDVCPPGWHVPTLDELTELVPVFTSSWIGDSFTDGKYLIIGDYAIRWRLVATANGYAEVKMLPAGVNGFTAANVAGLAWWNDARTETRYFPAAGYRAATTGAAVTNINYYWTAKAVTYSTSYALSFTSSTVVRDLGTRGNGFPVRCVAD